MSFTERRAAPRRVPGRLEPLARLRLRAGREVEVLNLSDVGALVEGHVRLLPGTHVEVHVVASSGRILARTRVVRALVSAIDAGGVRYRTALAFEQRIDTSPDGYSVPDTAADDALEGGTRYPNTTRSDTDEARERLPP